MPPAVPRLSIPAAIAAELARLDLAAPALWFWEPADRAVVLGLGGRAEAEVRLAAARADGVAVLQRRSGGGTVLLAPGALCFGLVLPRPLAFSPAEGEVPLPRALARRVLAPAAAALREAFGLLATVEGLGDLAVAEAINHQDTRVTKGISLEAGVRTPDSPPGAPGTLVVKRKICGTAQKWTARAILFHGSLLVDFDLALFERYLLPPPRAPEYRAGRAHADFCATLAGLLGRPVAPAEVAAPLARAWAETFGLNP